MKISKIKCSEQLFTSAYVNMSAKICISVCDTLMVNFCFSNMALT